MRVLAFDTSSPITAAAVVAGGEVIAEDDSATEARHGAVLLPRVQALLERAGLSLEDLELIAVGTGPGSFTGLRVGLATAKGLALATGVPLRGVCSLAALAIGARTPPGFVLPLLDAFKGEVYGALYRVTDSAELECLVEPLHAAPELAATRIGERLRELGAGEYVVCGDGALRYHDRLQPALADGARLAAQPSHLPRGRHVAALGQTLLEREGASDLAGLEPSYLRASDARLPGAVTA